MELSEIVFDESADIETGAVFETTVSLKDFVESMEKGNVKIEDQSFLTNGPRQKAKLIFTLKKNFDKRTSMIIHFSVFGESGENMVSVRIKAEIKTKAPEETEGFMGAVVDEYYMKKLYEKLRSHVKDTAKEIYNTIEKEFVGH